MQGPHYFYSGLLDLLLKLGWYCLTSSQTNVDPVDLSHRHSFTPWLLSKCYLNSLGLQSIEFRVIFIFSIYKEDVIIYYTLMLFMILKHFFEVLVNLFLLSIRSFCKWKTINRFRLAKEHNTRTEQKDKIPKWNMAYM